MAKLKQLMTIVIYASSGEKPKDETENRMASTMPRWVKMTPFGKPVVPDV